MMGKKKTKSFNFLFSLLAVATGATVFLSSYVLARFSTAASGGGATSVSQWDVTITPQTNTSIPSNEYSGAVTFGMLSPGDNTTLGYLNYSKSSTQSLATVTYKTSVDVDFSVESSNLTLIFKDNSTLMYNGSSYVIDCSCADNTNHSCTANSVSTAQYAVTGNNGTGDTGSSTNNSSSITKYNTGESGDVELGSVTPIYSDIINLFTLEITDSKDSDAYDSSVVTAYHSATEKYITTGHKHTTDKWTENSTATDDTTVTITGALIWSIETPASGTTYWATYLCDWVGKYVDSVSCTLTYTARQASE